MNRKPSRAALLKGLHDQEHEETHKSATLVKNQRNAHVMEKAQTMKAKDLEAMK